MTSSIERVWELYTLKRELEIQLQDIDGMLRQALADAYEDGVTKLPNGYTIRRSETRSISPRRFSELYPELYAGALQAKAASYEPELTKSDIKAAIATTGASKEAQAAMLASIETGNVDVKFSLTKPLDPNPGRVVE